MILELYMIEKLMVHFFDQCWLLSADSWNSKLAELVGTKGVDKVIGCEQESM